MSWEIRGNGRRYYYRVIRQNGRLVKQYMGSGKQALSAAAADEAARETRTGAAQSRRAWRQPIQEVIAQLRESELLLKRLVAFHLQGAGWTQHHREWREPACRQKR